MGRLTHPVAELAETAAGTPAAGADSVGLAGIRTIPDRLVS